MGRTGWEKDDIKDFYAFLLNRFCKEVGETTLFYGKKSGQFAERIGCSKRFLGDFLSFEGARGRGISQEKAASIACSLGITLEKALEEGRSLCPEKAA